MLDKESTYLLQKIDCSCNDCIFMVRDSEKFKQSEALHHKWQLDYFNVIKGKILKKAADWKVKGDIEKHNLLIKEAEAMKFVFDRSTCKINYGKCTKFDKNVSFIPNVCQLHTQQCFKHRRE